MSSAASDTRPERAFQLNNAEAAVSAEGTVSNRSRVRVRQARRKASGARVLRELRAEPYCRPTGPSSPASPVSSASFAAKITTSLSAPLNWTFTTCLTTPSTPP